MNGKRRKGRQRKRLEDNIKAWAGMDKVPWADENRTGWKGVVVKQGYAWMDCLRVYVLLNSISDISGRWTDDNERLCAVKPLKVME